MKKNKDINIGIVGATGKVGETFLSLLFERSFPFDEIRLFASQASDGKSHRFGEKDYSLNCPQKGSFKNLDLVFFASSNAISKQWVYEAIREGAYVIDNSSCFRMDSSHHLVVPEVNGKLISNVESPQIIASPNCSTIQLVLVLNPLFQAFGIEQVHVASYQAVSGAGKKAEKEFFNQIEDFRNLYKKSKVLNGGFSLAETFQEDLQKEENSSFPEPLAFNCIPQIGPLNPEGYCTEEEKIMNETKKILDAPDLKISAFTVRIPSWNAHGEALWVKLSKKVSQEDLLKCLTQASGLKIFSSERFQGKRENSQAQTYDFKEEKMEALFPHPLERSGKNEVGVGRIHKDLSDDRTWIFWVVGDNLRKGAALNAIQIAEILFKLKPYPVQKKQILPSETRIVETLR